MGKDQVDPKAAQALAWTFADNPQQLRQALRELPAPTVEEVDVLTALERERQARFEARIRAWREGLEAQLTALEAQTAPASQSLIELIDFVVGPPTWLNLVDRDLSHRLAMCLLEKRSRLDPAQRKRAAETAAQCLNGGAAQFEPWVLAVVRAGDADFCQAVGDICLDLGGDQPLGGQPQRLGDALEVALKDPGVTSAGKLLALRCLNASDWPVDRAAVAPSLADPDWRLRYHAVALLSASDQLTAEDVLGLLRDAASSEQPMTEWFELDASIEVGSFQAELGQALLTLRPPGAGPLLLALLPIRRFDGDLLNPAWAMRLLTQLEPALAEPAIAQLLLSFAAWERAVALEGLAELPVTRARAGLLRLCSDPVPRLVGAAHDLFFSKTGMASPLEPLAVLPPGRLQQPPSRTLRFRLDIATEATLERRLELRDQLVSLAHAGQATLEDTLVLVTLFCDEALLADPPEVEGFYTPLTRRLAHLRPLLGEELELALVAMAERFPGGECALLEALGDLHRQQPLTPAALTRARHLAHARLDGHPGPKDHACRSTLADLGALPERWEALYPEALTEGGWSQFLALVRCGPQPALDARLQLDATGPLDPVLRARVVDLALQRGLREQTAAGLVLVDQAQTIEQVDAVLPLMQTLIEQGALSRAALRRELEDASHPRFLLGFFALRDAAAQEPGVDAALINALGGPGRVTFLVVHALTCRKVLAPDDPRARAALERMDIHEKSLSLYALLSQGADPEPLAGHLLDVLCHGDAEEVGRVDMYLEKSSFGRALIAQATRAPARA